MNAVKPGDYVVISDAPRRLTAVGQVERVLPDGTVMVARPVHVRGHYSGTYACILPQERLRIDPEFFRANQRAYAAAGHPWALA